jgi:hypothetical protein
MAAEQELGGGGRGGLVRETGLALVHEGELIVPAPGSEAAIDTVTGDPRTVVQYVFPVEIEVRGPQAAPDPHAVADLALDRLSRHLGAD